MRLMSLTCLWTLAAPLRNPPPLQSCYFCARDISAPLSAPKVVCSRASLQPGHSILVSYCSLNLLWLSVKIALRFMSPKVCYLRHSTPCN